MRLVEIAGHNIDPRMVADVGPIRPIGTNGIDTWGFQVCASGVTIWDFIYKEGAEKVRRSLLTAIESAEQAARESLQEATHWRKAWPRIKMTDADIAEAQKLMGEYAGASDVLLGVDAEDEQTPVFCPSDCADGIPEVACCRLCVITGARAGRIAP